MVYGIQKSEKGSKPEKVCRYFTGTVYSILNFVGYNLYLYKKNDEHSPQTSLGQSGLYSLFYGGYTVGTMESTTSYYKYVLIDPRAITQNRNMTIQKQVQAANRLHGM